MKRKIKILIWLIAIVAVVCLAFDADMQFNSGK